LFRDYYIIKFKTKIHSKFLNDTHELTKKQTQKKVMKNFWRSRSRNKIL